MMEERQVSFGCVHIRLSAHCNAMPKEHARDVVTVIFPTCRTKDFRQLRAVGLGGRAMVIAEKN